MTKKPYHQKALNRVPDYRYPEAKKVVADMLVYQKKILKNKSLGDKYILDRCLLIDHIIINLPLRITPDKVNRKFLLKFIEQLNKHNGNGCVLVQFFICCFKNGLYNKNELEAWNSPEIWETLTNSVRSISIIQEYLALEEPIDKFVLYKRPIYKQVYFIPLNGMNSFLEKLLPKLLPKLGYNNYLGMKTCTYMFFYLFVKSFGNLPLPKDIWGFTPDTFRQQVLFYSNEKFYKNNLYMLKQLYITVIREYQGEQTIFTIANGMTEQFINSNHVTHLIKNDYHMVQLISTLEPYEFDNWIIEKTGNYTSSEIGDKGRLFNPTFTDVPIEFKNILKRWLMYNHHSVRVKSIFFPKIKKFLQYLVKRREKTTSIINDKTILFEEVIDYINSIKTKCFSTDFLKDFLQFLQETKLYPVDMACIKFIPSGSKGSSEKDITPIEEKDYYKMLEGLSNLSKDDHAYAIYKIAFAVFIVMSLSELRISSILSLSLEDFKEYGKGQYCVMSNTKTSRGHKKTYGITPFIYKVFQRIINYTARFRENAPENIKKMLFITPYGKVVDGHTINRVFYKVCKLQGIPYYTTGNLRKTYMTNVARHARKNGRSLSGLEQLFDHKSTTTTLKFYAKFTEEEILMTICNEKAITPLEKVRKHIEPDVVHPHKYKVSDGAGYCKQEACNIDGMAECFVCKHFVTSLSCYDSFVIKKQKLESLLEKDELGDEIKEGYDLILRILNMYIVAMESQKGERACV